MRKEVHYVCSAREDLLHLLNSYYAKERRLVSIDSSVLVLLLCELLFLIGVDDQLWSDWCRNSLIRYGVPPGKLFSVYSRMFDYVVQASLLSRYCAPSSTMVR